MEIGNIFSQNLKYYRFKRGYAQEKLAKLSHLGTKTICHYERCISSFLAATVGEIAKALKIDYFRLFEAKDMNIELEERMDIFQKHNKI